MGNFNFRMVSYLIFSCCRFHRALPLFDYLNSIILFCFRMSLIWINLLFIYYPKSLILIKRTLILMKYTRIYLKSYYENLKFGYDILKANKKTWSLIPRFKFRFENLILDFQTSDNLILITSVGHRSFVIKLHVHQLSNSSANFGLGIKHFVWNSFQTKS